VPSLLDDRLLTLDGFGDPAVLRDRGLADVDLLGDDGALLDLNLLFVERDSDALGVILVDLVGGPPVDRAALDVHLVARHRHVERLLFADDTFADFHRTGLLRRLGGAELLLPKLDGASFSPAILHRGRTDRAGSPGGGHLVPTKLVDLVLVDVQVDAFVGRVAVPDGRSWYVQILLEEKALLDQQVVGVHLGHLADLLIVFAEDFPTLRHVLHVRCHIRPP